MKKICPTCNGSGQISSFKGVSRFLLSWEECEECSGLGYLVDADADGTRRGNRDKPKATPPQSAEKGFPRK